MPLNTLASIPELSPDQFERIIQNARVKRLLLRAEFRKANNLKLSIQSRRTKELMNKQLTLLAKDILRLDELLDKCQARLDKVKIVRNQVTYLDDAIAEED